MRVAVLAHSFPRFPGDTHGPFVKNLSEAISRRGHDITALVPWDPELGPDPETPLSIESFRYVWPPGWHQLGYSRTMQRDVRLKSIAYLQAPLYFWFAERALASLVRRRSIDFVHAHWILPNGYIAARVAARLGVPFAATLHGSDVFMAERNPFFGRMAARALAGASHVTSCSADLRDRLLAVGGDEHSEKVLLVPNGTEASPRDSGEVGEALRARLGIDAGAPLLAAVGRLVDKKGFRYLIEAMPTVLERHPTARLALGGGGPLEDDLRRRVAAAGVGDAVVFTGGLAHPDVLSLVAAADLFVMPSVRDPRGNIDGLPIVVLEAMAAGTPVIATDVAGMPLAVASGETGLLVPEQDPGALATAINELLDDPDRARRFGEAGRERVETELNWDAVARVHDELYRAAVGEAR